MDKLDSYRRYNKRDDLFPNRSGGALDIDELIRIINRDSDYRDATFPEHIEALRRFQKEKT